MEKDFEIPDFRNEPRKLATLAHAADLSESVWRESDFAGIWLHQLNAIIWVELATIDPHAAMVAADLHGRSPTQVGRSLAELAEQDSPSKRMLCYAESLGDSLLLKQAEVIPRTLGAAYRDLAAGMKCFGLGVALGGRAEAELRGRLTELNTTTWIDEKTKRRINQWLR